MALIDVLSPTCGRKTGLAVALTSLYGQTCTDFDVVISDQTLDDEVYLEAASAKIRCAEAAEKGGAIAHQVHGAIGFTSEHILHRFSLRALAWRDDFGSESHWAVELGKLVANRGADELWPLVASR